VTYRDVVAPFAAFETTTDGAGATAFDSTRNGRLDFADVVALSDRQ
jgi:hypothetical protein